jgi:hypothetical protein
MYWFRTTVAVEVKFIQSSSSVKTHRVYLFGNRFL